MTPEQIIAIGTAVASVFTAIGTLLVYLLSRKIHVLTNSAMGAALLASMISARALADAEPTPANNKLAEDAEQKYIGHQKGQSIVDRRAL